MQHPPRADFDEDLALQRLCDVGIAEPIDVAQPDAAGALRLARADYDAARAGVEPHHAKRRARATPSPRRWPTVKWMIPS